MTRAQAALVEAEFRGGRERGGGVLTKVSRMAGACRAGEGGVMTRSVSPGGIEVTTPAVDGVQRLMVKDVGGIGGRTSTWPGGYFTEAALYARLAELGTDPAGLEEVPSGFRPCPVHRDRDHAELGLPARAVRSPGVRAARQRSMAGQDPGTWSCFGGESPKANHPAGRRARVPRGGARDDRRPGTTSYVGECAACGWQYTTSSRTSAWIGRAAGGTRWPGDRPGQVGRVAHVRYLNLGPGFAVAWVNLRHAVEAPAASETTS